MSRGELVSGERIAARMGRGADAAPADAEFWRLFGEARPRLRLIAAAVLGGVTDADDVVHDAAMIGRAKFSTFVIGTNFDAWMGQITRLTALGARRTRARFTGAADISGNDAASERPVGDTAMETGKRLDAAMHVLDETARSCLLLRVVGGLDYDAISEILSIPKGTAMSHVSRARLALRGELERDPTWGIRTAGGAS